MTSVRKANTGPEQGKDPLNQTNFSVASGRGTTLNNSRIRSQNKSIGYIKKTPNEFLTKQLDPEKIDEYM